MNYSKNYTTLKKLFTSTKTDKEFDTIELHNIEFESASCGILPGKEEYKCDIHNVSLKEEFSFYTEIGTIDKNVQIGRASCRERV